MEYRIVYNDDADDRMMVKLIMTFLSKKTNKQTRKTEDDERIDVVDASYEV